MFFFFNDTATTEIYTLSLHDALPISYCGSPPPQRCTTESIGATVTPVSSYRSLRTAFTRSASLRCSSAVSPCRPTEPRRSTGRSEEHTSELQSRQYLVCRLLLEKKNH